MRWMKKDKGNLDYKIVKRFALFPIQVKNEYRWFETCYIVKERWFSWYESGWINKSWTDKETYEMWKNGYRYSCADSSCKYCINGELCSLGKEAKIEYTICYSRRSRNE